MTGKERVISAFQHKEGDRVPVFEQVFASDVASEILGRNVQTGSSLLHYQEALAWTKGDQAHAEFEVMVWEGIRALAREIGLDAVRMPWRVREQPTKQLDEYMFLYGDYTEKNWKVRKFDPVSQNFGLVDSWDRHAASNETLSGPEMVPKLVEEMERAASDRRSITADDFPELKRLIDEFGKEFVVMGEGGFGIPCDPNWLEALLLFPEAIAEYLDLQVERLLEAIQVQARMGIKIIWASADMADKNGPLYSPKIFHQYMLPRLKTITTRCNELDVYFLFRSGGNLWPIADDLFHKSGIHGYGEIEGDAGMNLRRLKADHGHLTFWGNLSCGLLRTGTKGALC